MSPGERERLDRAILAIVRTPNVRTGLTYSAICGRMLEHLPHGWNEVYSPRAVDASLQRLRKRGLIHYYSPAVGWKAGYGPREALGRGPRPPAPGPMAYRRDASWHPKPRNRDLGAGEHRAWHLPSAKDPAKAACGRAVLFTDDPRPATATAVDLRCTRSGCRQAWDEIDAQSIRTMFDRRAG